MFDRFPWRIMAVADLHATRTHGVKLSTVIYNNNFCISIGVEHLNLYQHFACQPQINACTSIINCTQTHVIAHTNTSVLMTYFALDYKLLYCYITKRKKHTRGQYKHIIIYLPSTVHTDAKINPRKIFPRIDICK